MKIARVSLLFILLIGLPIAAKAEVYRFGEIPLSDVMDAAASDNECGTLSANKLAAYMLAAPWWEVTGGDTAETPSPMTLGRFDDGPTLYPPGQTGPNAPHRRAFWHPGIGAWQLDDRGVGTDLSLERFNTRDAAKRVANEMSTRYCSDTSALSVFGRWCACASTGSCAASDRSRCEQTFNEIYNPSGPPTVEANDEVGRYGGSQVRICRLADQTATFVCVYVNPSLAEGYTGSWIDNEDGTPPLTEPFYVYKEAAAEEFEWRYWMTEDTGFGTDYAAQRAYGIWSKVELTWIPSAEVTSSALCDVTMSRGACPAVSNLGQLKHDGSALGIGAGTAVGSVILRGTVSSNRDKPVRLDLEVVPTTVAFSGDANYPGAFGSSGSRSKCVSGLPVGKYHWRARTLEEDGAASPWVSFGNNSESATDFEVTQSGSCVTCSASAASGALEFAVSESCEESLVATLVGSPASGSAPMNDVSLTASVGGTATGAISYTFYCNRADSGTNITPGYAARYTGTSANPKTAAGICDYNAVGTYTAKVIVERGSSVAEDRTTITVTTSGLPVPTVTTLAATSVTQASVTFNASINPNGSNTAYWFDYGPNTSVSLTTLTRNLAAATSPSAVSITQDGLSCGQQYFYRSRASNAGGPATPGSLLSFATDACGGGGGSDNVQLVVDPSFEAGDGGWWVADQDFYIDDQFTNERTGRFYAYLSNSDGSRGNNLSGGVISPYITIPANATDADLRFWYSITSDETTTSTVFDKVQVYLVRPPDQLNLIATISNLDENGTSYDLESRDLSSSFYGDTVQIFFAGFTDGSLPSVFRIDDVTLDVDVPSGSAPTVETEAANQITASSARLNMTVDPNSASTTVWFDLEAGDSTPNDDTEHISIGSGSQSESVSISVFDLQCATLYYFQAEASNSFGSDSGTVRSFTTTACSGGPPNADTDPAENITQTSATLTADVDPNGLSTQAWFAWGDTPDFEQETSHVTVGSGTGNVDFSQSLSGLSCGTTYYFENHASNSAGHDDGVTLSFTTEACDSGNLPVVTVSVVDATADEASLGIGIVRISRTGGTGSSLPLAMGISGTATNVADYEDISGFIDIPAGSAYRDIIVRPVQDAIAEPAEAVTVTIFDTTIYDLGAQSSGTVTIIDDDVTTTLPLDFYTVTPCRLADTRQAPVPLYPGITQTFPVGGVCGVPTPARAVSINATVVADTFGGHITIFPADQSLPPTSTINFGAGQTRANNAVLGLSADGRLAALATLSGGSVHLILDVNGYFAEAVHPMVGTWEGTIATYASVLYIEQDESGFSARVSMDEANEPIEDLTIISVSETEFRAYRPLDNNAELRLALVHSGVQKCLNGEYLELGTSRPISLCARVSRALSQGAPGEVGKDIWTTSYYSYTPVQGTPGGGLDDHRLRVGGWGDSYYSLLEFDLSGLPQHAQTARIELFPTSQPGGAAGMTALYLDRITEFWDWRTQGTGSDRERLWWADRPDAVQWRSGTIPAPTLGQWYSIDITDLYNAWKAGTYPNYGVQLRPVSTNNMWAEFYSANYADDPALRPRLVVVP